MTVKVDNLSLDGYDVYVRCRFDDGPWELITAIEFKNRIEHTPPLHSQSKGNLALMSNMSLVKVVRDSYDANTVAGQGWRLEPINWHHSGEALRAKLMEEVAEYLEDRTPEELCDIIEVCIALAAQEHNMSFSELMIIADEKRVKKGGFKRVLGLYLEPPETFEDRIGTLS